MKATHIVRAGVLALALASVSCGSVVRDGNGTSFLIVQRLEAASGAEPGEFAQTLFSDVVTVVDDVPTTFADLGRVTFSLGLKDPGTAANPNTPTQNQAVTIDRYHVRYFRADGRNVQGVDVPYEFDGAFTVTVSGTADANFQIVRHTAKNESPLGGLTSDPAVITTIAEVTFYGRDQTGHQVSTTGRITVNFGNFGDPD